MSQYNITKIHPEQIVSSEWWWIFCVLGLV